ncbi:hypothetical protein ACOMHN_016618 [Nucella lapillus]
MGPKCLKYSEESITAACQAVRNGNSLRTAAKEHGVPHTTLRDRLKGRISIRQKPRTVLPPEEEGKVLEWLKESSRRGFGRTKQQLISPVETVVTNSSLPNNFKNNRPGRKWYSNFMKRHKDELSVRKPQGLGAQRAAVTEEKLARWFHQAKQDIEAVDPDVLNDPSQIFNCDESGFQLGGGICPVLAPKGDKHVYQVTNDTHKQITVLACGNAAGEVQPPLLIFPGQRFGYDPLEGFQEAHLARSSNGWIDTEIFQSWFETAFCPSVAHLQKPVVLFADGHATHLSMKVHELCNEHGIIVYQFPSHASHLIQPLDLTTFKSLKQVWREEVMSFQERTSTTLGKKDFAAVFKKAWERGVPKDVVVSGFRGAGIFPWNPARFDRKKLTPSRLFATPTRTETETRTPTQAETETRTPTQAETETRTPTQTETETRTPTRTETETRTPTQAETETRTPTQAETETRTPTQTETETRTPTRTETETRTPTQAETETRTPTQAETETRTPTQTETETRTPTRTETETRTPTQTETRLTATELAETRQI